jgi:hypothetical protein
VPERALGSAAFTINKWGGCRLNPQMAKVIVEKVSGLDSGGVIGKSFALDGTAQRLRSLNH